MLRIYISTHIYVYIIICISSYVYQHLYIYIYQNMYINMCVSVYVYHHMYINMHIYQRMYINMCVSTYVYQHDVCMYIRSICILREARRGIRAPYVLLHVLHVCDSLVSVAVCPSGHAKIATAASVVYVVIAVPTTTNTTVPPVLVLLQKDEVFHAQLWSYKFLFFAKTFLLRKLLFCKKTIDWHFFVLPFHNVLFEYIESLFPKPCRVCTVLFIVQGLIRYEGKWRWRKATLYAATNSVRTYVRTPEGGRKGGGARPSSLRHPLRHPKFVPS